VAHTRATSARGHPEATDRVLSSITPSPLRTSHIRLDSTKNTPTMAESPKVTMQANDGTVVTVDPQVAKRSMLVTNLFTDLGEEMAQGTPIPLPNVNGAVLFKITEYCEHHKNDPAVDDSDEARRKTTEIDEWDQKFMQVDQEMLFEIILAANYLDIKDLLDVGCKTVANMIKGKSPEEIRKTFNITNDFTADEEDQIRRENEWAEDR